MSGRLGVKELIVFGLRTRVTETAWVCRESACVEYVSASVRVAVVVQVSMPALRDTHPVQLVDAAAVLDSELTDNASSDGGLSFDILLMPACRLCRTDGPALPVRVDLVEVVPQVGLVLFQRSHG